MSAMQKSNDDRICCLANVPLLIVDNDSSIQESDGDLSSNIPIQLKVYEEEISKWITEESIDRTIADVGRK
jgi:hypothetical protein